MKLKHTLLTVTVIMAISSVAVCASDITLPNPTELEKINVSELSREELEKSYNELRSSYSTLLDLYTEMLEQATTEKTEHSDTQRDLPEGNYQEIGEGTFDLKNQSGSTKNGDEIIVYPKTNSYPLAYIDYSLWDMDGKLLTYIYLDGVQMAKEQVGSGFQSSLALMEEWQVSEGVHIVEAVQYKDNNTAGEMTFYRSRQYTVKNE